MVPRTTKPKVTISSSQNALRVPRRKIADLIDLTARLEDVAIHEVDVAVVDDSQIAALNRRYLRRPGPTDVLSFDMGEPGASGLCAQIVVCAQVAVAEARRRRTGPQAELMLYVLHGLLHLLGYDDLADDDAERMHARQDEILAVVGKSRKGR